jgi:hypothetical protein
METITDSKGKTYKVSTSGTAYHGETEQRIIDILDKAWYEGTRLIFDWGDAKTGKSWGEDMDIRGTIGRSTGSIKIPLLIATKRSRGDGAILDNCIVKITRSQDKKVLYQHPNYHA